MSTAANETRNETLVREFFDTLSSGDLEALRPLIHLDGSWEATSSPIRGAGVTRGRTIYALREYMDSHYILMQLKML